MNKLYSGSEIFASKNRVMDVVNGGAIFTNLSTFWDSCISRFGEHNLTDHLKANEANSIKVSQKSVL